jgi:hypothetical protein
MASASVSLKREFELSDSVRLCRPCCAESLWLSVCGIEICGEAAPRSRQGAALPLIKGALDGKAEPFSTARAAEAASIELTLNL